MPPTPRISSRCLRKKYSSHHVLNLSYGATGAWASQAAFIAAWNAAVSGSSCVRRRSSTGVKSAPPPNQAFVVTTKRVFMCPAGTCGLCGCAISEMPDAQKRGSSAAPGIWPWNSGANSPCTVETCTPTFSNTRPFIIDMTPPPPGLPEWSVRAHGVRTKRPGLRAASGAFAGRASSTAWNAAQISSRNCSNQARARACRSAIIRRLLARIRGASARDRQLAVLEEIARLRAGVIAPAKGGPQQALAERRTLREDGGVEGMRVRLPLVGIVVVLRDLLNAHTGRCERLRDVDVAEPLGVEQRLGGAGAAHRAGGREGVTDQHNAGLKQIIGRGEIDRADLDGSGDAQSAGELRKPGQ